MGKLFDTYVASYCLDRIDSGEFFDIVGDLYYADEVQGLAVYPQHSAINRLDHIRSVTYMSYVYCKKLSLDYRAATRGAMLHDLFYYDWHDGDWSHRPHGYRHPGFALKNARVLNPAITKKEENIILRHMFPLTVIPPRYAEGWVVSLCDKYCATRELLIADHTYFRNRFEKKKGELLYFKELLTNV